MHYSFFFFFINIRHSFDQPLLFPCWLFPFISVPPFLSHTLDRKNLSPSLTASARFPYLLFCALVAVFSPLFILFRLEQV